MTTQQNQQHRQNIERLSIDVHQAAQQDTQDGDVAVMMDVELVPMYAIIMHNDDYTPMDFVVGVLMEVLHLPMDEAYYLMLMIHHEGRANVGLYPKEIAETKAMIITQQAQAYEYPLLTTIEPA